MAVLTLGLGFTTEAPAVPWSIDLSSYNVEGGNLSGTSSIIEFSELMNISNAIAGASLPTVPSTRVIQDFGGDGILNDGDSFSEFGFINQLGRDGAAISFIDSTTNEARYLYFSFEGLAGTIDNYSDINGDGDTEVGNLATHLPDDRFDLNFASGVGTISFWLDDNFDHTDGTIAQLADFSLINGNGVAPRVAASPSGVDTNGTINLQLGFNSVANNVWTLTDVGTTFESWMSTYGTPSIFGGVNVNAAGLLIGPTANGFEAEIENSGTFRVSAVPEPSTFLLLGGGLAGLAFFGRKKLKIN